MSITSAIIISGDLVIENGQSSAGLLVEGLGYVIVENGGLLEDSIATSQGMITVDPGGLLQRTDVEEDGFLVIDGTAEEITARDSGSFQVYTGGALKNSLLEAGGNGVIGAGATATDTDVAGGYFMLYGGTGENTVVSSGGSFVVQLETGKAVKTTVMNGGIMRLISAGAAETTTVSGGFLEVLGGSASGTILTGGSMRVNEGDTVQDTTLNGGKMEIIAATAIATVVNGGEVKAVSASTLQSVTLNGGTLTAEGGMITNALIDSGAAVSISGATIQTLTMNDADSLILVDLSEMSGISIKGGTGTFTGVSVNALEVGSAAQVGFDSASVISGNAVFAEGATVALAGTTVTFDTSVATETEAQIKGLSALTGDAVYTLNAGVDVGIYLLATGAEEFNSDVVFGQYTLRLNEEPVKIGDLVYSIDLNAGVLDLTIEEYVPPTPGIVTLAYANSEWAELADGTEVKIGSTMATIGTNAFATGDAATAAVAEVEDGKVRVAGGTVNFASGVTKNTTVYSGAEITNSDVAAGVTLVVNNGAKLTGKAAFAAGATITVNGTLVFDTQYATDEAAQFTGFSAVSGNAKYTLNAAPVAGIYLLASDAVAFTGDVTFGDVTLKVGEEAVIVDEFTYALGITDNGELALTVTSVVPPTLAYVNSEWSDKKDGDTVPISETVTAAIGYDAFATLAPAIAAVTDDGEIEIVGGEISFAEGYSKTITVDAGATIIGKAVFDKPITVNGAFAFDIANATAEAAQFGGFSFVTGSTSTTYTLTAATPVIGSYLLATDAAAFTGTVAFGDVTLAVGAEAVKVGNFTYALSLTEGNLALTIAEYIPPTPTLAYVNSEWSGKMPGDTVPISETVTATIGYDAFAALAPAIAAVTDDGAVEIVGGKVSFNDGYSKTITVDAGATVVGKAVFDKPITINGTIAFDTANTTAEAAQFGGFSFVTGSTTTTYTLTAATPAVGTYLLATDAAAFAGTVAFGDVTLTVGAEAVAIGQFTYALSLTEGSLVLEIAKNIPTLSYVNSLWSTLPSGSTVTVGDKNATIGYDAFAALAPAEAAVTDDGAIEIVGGTVSFADGYTKTITVDAGATVIGKATFDKAITIDGTIAFDIANATAETAQFGGFSFITGSTSTAYTLAAATPAVGTYLLATDVTAFAGTVKFGPGSLTVGAEATVIGDFTYALTLNEGVLALTIDEYVPPTPTLTLAYVNSEWANLASGTTVQISDTVTATIGVDAFSSGDVAIANVLAEGMVEVVGGEVFFTNSIAKSVTIDAGATLIGKAAFTKSITIDGAVAFDTQYATATAAQFTDFSFVTGSTSTVYTLTAANPVVGTYLLASNAATFNSGVLFNDITLTVGAEAVQVGDFTYALAITDNNDLALLIKTAGPEPPPVPTLAYVNSEWADKQPGDTVQISDTVIATIGFDAFATLAPAIEAVTDDGAIEVVGGMISFADGYSKTITVDADATVFGKAVFDKPITVNGAFAFDIDNATAEVAQFGGFSFVTGSTTTTYTLTAAEPVIGDFLLATDAAAFDSDVLFGDITLTVGAEPVQFGDFTLALSLTEGNLVLTIAEYIPPTPSLAYVNSEWAALEDGTPVQISETITATIGYDAFAALALAEAAVTDDGAVEIVDGTVSFADGYSKTITVDADATVVGNAVFDKPITINGTVAFDPQYATAEAAQFGGFSFVTGSTTTTYTLTDATPVAGTYLLATDAAEFNSDVMFGDVTLTVGAEATVVGDFSYALSLTEGNLALTVAEYTPPTPTLAYVNSEWAGLPDKTVVTVGDKTAVIGYNAFAALDSAIAAVPDDGAVEVAGGEVSFARGYSKTITVDADATVVGEATFKTTITINGTIAFDTQYMTSAYAQFSTFSNIYGTPTYTLTDSVKTAGTYQLASGAKGFKGDIKFSVYTLKVGGTPIRVGNFTYAVSLMGGSLSLTVEKAKAPSSRPKLVYVNSEWANLTSGTTVKINSTTFATLGKDAFADGDTAACTVTPKDGEIQIVGGSAFFTEDASGIIVSSGASLDLNATVTLTGVTILDGGTMTAGSGAVVDTLAFEGGSASAVVIAGGTVANAGVSDGAHMTVSKGGLAKDIELAGGDSAEEYGFLVVGEGGSASGITVSDGGSLTTDNGSFLTRLTVFGGQTNIGGTATKVTLYDSMNVTGWGVVTKAKVAEGGSISTFNAGGVGSVQDSEIQSGGSILNAGFVSGIQVKDGGILKTFDSGIANATEVQDGGIFIVSGIDATACDLSLVEGSTVTVTDGARLTGRITTGDGAFIEMDDGTVLEFNLSSLPRPADYALVSDFSAIAGLPNLVLTVSTEQEGGVYLLAGGADGFDRGITLGEYTLTLESEPVTIGSSTFSLNLSDDGVLSLFIDVPVFFVNSDWAGLEDGTPITVEGEGIDAVIGVDAFATGDAAAAASPASAEIRVVGGTVSFAEGIRKKTIIRSGVELTNTNVYATLTLENGAVLSGKSMFDGEAAVFGEGTILFNTANVEEGRPQFIDLSRFEGSPAYVLASGATIGEYVFATDAADMRYQGIQVADDVTAYVSRAEFPVLKDEGGAQLSYVFDLTQDNDLTLSVVKVKNELDNGWNNYVYDKKTKILNPLLDTFVSTALEDGVKGILLDDKGTVYSDGRRNYVGGIKGGVTDDYDYAKITLEQGARLSLNLESTGAGKFTIWQLVEGTDKKGNVTYTMKSIQATSLKKDKTTGRYVATTKDLLIEAGDYYISMQATEAGSKNGSYAFYNAEINYADDRTHFFVDGDNGWNNYVYDKKTKELSPAVIDDDLLDNMVGKAGDVVQLDSPAAAFQIENRTLTNFVGFGDDADYATLMLPYDSSLVFNVTATDASKFTIWQLVESVDKKGIVSYKMKELQTTALKKDKITGLYTAETKELRLNLDLTGSYYVSVQSTNAKKGGAAYYSVVASDKSVFYTDADNGWNDYVYDKNREEPLNKVLYDSTGTLIYKKMGDIQLDTAGTVSEQVGGTTFTNFVGYGDDADYLKITLEKASTLSFNVTATNASKFVIYQLVEGLDKKGNVTYTMKVIQSSTLKKADKYAEFYTVAGGTKPTKNLEAGDYYIAVIATDAKKGELAYYNVSLNDVGCSNLPNQPVQQPNVFSAQDASALDMPAASSVDAVSEIAGFSGIGDALADISAAITDVQESKSAWHAMLA